MTVNTLNYECVEEVIRDWYGYARGLTLQFHTPFSYDDKLWLPYGKLRDRTIDKILKMKENYSGFIANTSKQLNLFRDAKWTVNCPKWFFVNLDASGRTKRSCVISNTDENGIEPICGRCGITCNSGAYSGLVLSDTEWLGCSKLQEELYLLRTDSKPTLRSHDYPHFNCQWLKSKATQHGTIVLKRLPREMLHIGRDSHAIAWGRSIASPILSSLR
jgi:hypothetical protein